jgi:type VI secretion system protein ImpF
MPSLLDRLIDLEPNVPDVLPTRVQSVRDFRRAVCRDLEQLLNTHNPLFDLPPAFTETSRSVVAFGIADFSSLNITDESLGRVRQMLETAIRTFEPRLSSVAVTVRERDGSGSIALHIDAKLLVDPSPVPIAFDIGVPLHTRECQVKDVD